MSSSLENDFSAEIEEYQHLKSLLDDPIIRLPKKTLKQHQSRMQALQNSIPDFDAKWMAIQTRNNRLEDIERLQYEIHFNETYFEYYEGKILELLKDQHYLNDSLELTEKGVIACDISDCNPIFLTEFLVRDVLDDLSGPEIAVILSTLMPSSSKQNESIVVNLLQIPDRVKRILKYEWLRDLADFFFNAEARNELYLNTNWELNFTLAEQAFQWASNHTTIELPSGTFQGDFVKDMIKLGALTQTVAKSADLLHKTKLVGRMKELEQTIMRGIVTVNSLYIR